MITQDKSKRKATGGRYRSSYTKRVKQAGSAPMLTKIGKKILKPLRTKGGNQKDKLASIDTVNLYNPTTKKYEKATLKNIVSNSANRHFVRRNILTKGCIVETSKGKARITSRPGQTGSLNAVLEA